MNHETVNMNSTMRNGNSKLMYLMLLWIVISEIGCRFEKTKQVNDMFSFLWNLSKVTSTDDNEVAERTIEICCKNLSNIYPHDLNEQGLLEELRILERLQKSDILDEKLTSIALLNKIYEKGLKFVLLCGYLCAYLCLFHQEKDLLVNLV